MIPIVVFLLIGGVLADRFGRAEMVGGTDLIGSVIVSVNGLLFITGYASVVQLGIAAFAIGTLNALWYPAFSGLLPEVVDVEHLQSANSLIGFSTNIGFTIGASVAGILVSTFGPGWAILVDGGTFFIAGILVWQLRSVSQRNHLSQKEEPMVTQLKQGWDEFRSRRWLVVIVGSFSLINMCFEAFLAVLAPLQMKESLGGARHMGFMMFAWGAGSVAGVLVSLRIRARKPLIIAMGVIPILGFWMASLALRLSLPVIMLLAFATGIALDVFYVLWMTTMQSNVPHEALSRVGSYDAFGSNILVPIGLLAAGPLAAAFGVRSVLIGGAVVTIALSIGSLMSPDVRAVRNKRAHTRTHVPLNYSVIECDPTEKNPLNEQSPSKVQ
jgi:MFS family permease